MITPSTTTNEAPDNKGTVLPVYLITDQSPSMADHLDALNHGVRSLFNSLNGDNTFAAAVVRISVVGFADAAAVQLPMCDFRDIRMVPELGILGSTTSYGSVFKFLQSQIPTDIRTLRDAGYGSYRPATFFLSDGEPMDAEDNWKAELNRLRDPSFQYHPNILAFGLGEAALREEIVAYIATAPGYGYVAESPNPHMTGAYLAKFFSALTQSVVASARAIIKGEFEIVSESPEGFRMVLDPVS